MGLMSLEDAIAWSRNVVAAKVALNLAPDAPGRVDGAPRGLDAVRVREPNRHRPRRRGRRARPRPGHDDVAGDRPRERSLRAGGRRDPAPARGRVRGDDERRDARRRRTWSGRSTGCPRRPPSRGPAMDASLSPTLVDLMHHVVATVPFYRDRTLIPGYFVGGKTGTAQIWDSRGRRLEVGRLQLLVRRLRRPADRPPGPRHRRPHQRGPPDASGASGQLEMPVMSFELFRRIATDAIAHPGPPPGPPGRGGPGRQGERMTRPAGDAGRRRRRRLRARVPVRHFRS